MHNHPHSRFAARSTYRSNFHRRFRSAGVFTAMLLLFSSGRASAQEAFDGWNLEPSVGQAHLVMVARVASVGDVTVVEGAKTDVSLREYRFQPVRVLKGIFKRDRLSMTGADLGISAEHRGSTPPVKEEELRLLILSQRQQFPLGSFPTYCCASPAPGAITFEERVPLLTGLDDPLVGVVETLIKVADSRSRRERAKLLIDRLADVDGLAAVPLLTSLERRADCAAADPRACSALSRLAASKFSVVRSAALEVARGVFATHVNPADEKQLDAMAESLRKVIESDEAVTRVRLAALEALGHIVAMKPNLDGVRELLIKQLSAAATNAERDAAVKALAESNHADAAAAVLDALAKLPLDELPAREAIYARAALRLNNAASTAGAAENILLARLERSIAARQSLESEIRALGEMRSKQSLPILLAAASQPNLLPNDRYQIAWALGRIGDDRAVPVLVGWMREADYFTYLKENSLAALETLDSPAAAREARSLLRPEAQMPYKLRIARLLARHGIADGYALATEHLADDAQTPAATLALAALNDPRTLKELSALLETRPDRRWHGAALIALAALRDAAARKELLQIMTDDRHPLVADAAEAAGLAGDRELLPPLAKLVHSRNKKIADAALVAMRRYFSDVRSSPRGLAAVGQDSVEHPVADEELPPSAKLPAETQLAIAKAVATLAVDAYVDAESRYKALMVAKLLGGDDYAKLLSELADQAELENSHLLNAVKAEQRRLREARRQITAVQS